MKFLIIVFFSIVTFNLNAQDVIFEKIDNKTWFENGFAGINIVFYRTTNELFKAIRQINGSGVPGVILSEIYDVEIRSDTIYLMNGLNLKTAEKVGNYFYKLDKKTGFIYKNEIQLKSLFDKPILFTWTEKRKDFTTQINFSLLSKISINKNEIYKETDLIQILVDK